MIDVWPILVQSCRYSIAFVNETHENVQNKPPANQIPSITVLKGYISWSVWFHIRYTRVGQYIQIRKYNERHKKNPEPKNSEYSSQCTYKKPWAKFHILHDRKL